jgi:hypothetical protein
MRLIYDPTKKIEKTIKHNKKKTLLKDQLEKKTKKTKIELLKGEIK